MDQPSQDGLTGDFRRVVSQDSSLLIQSLLGYAMAGHSGGWQEKRGALPVGDVLFFNYNPLHEGLSPFLFAGDFEAAREDSGRYEGPNGHLFSPGPTFHFSSAIHSDEVVFDMVEDACLHMPRLTEWPPDFFSFYIVEEDISLVFPVRFHVSSLKPTGLIFSLASRLSWVELSGVYEPGSVVNLRFWIEKRNNSWRLEDEDRTLWYWLADQVQGQEQNADNRLEWRIAELTKRYGRSAPAMRAQLRKFEALQEAPTDLHSPQWAVGRDHIEALDAFMARQKKRRRTDSGE